MKAKKKFICSKCGDERPQWEGQCPSCQEWNTFQESTQTKSLKRSGQLQFNKLNSHVEHVERISTGMPELDRALGGGIVPGSITLISGEPGIGKSTLLLNLAGSLSKRKICTAYISGEESFQQIQLRAKRLEINSDEIDLASNSNCRQLIETIMASRVHELFIVDSIQTMALPEIDSHPGSATQVKNCTYEIVQAAKSTNKPVMIVGHVTKDGNIAGPKVLEHVVDTVIHFETDSSQQFRILRSSKNRFGATNEIGVFQMEGTGLKDVTNPSELFLNHDRDENSSGSIVFPSIEGTRPILLEVQALVTETPLATPRRNVVGWDSNRLAMLIAVLQSKGDINLANFDIHLNVVGGMKINDPASDLAIACALMSAYSNTSLPKDMLALGEIGLGGEIRPVTRQDERLKEARKLGFSKALIPTLKGDRKPGKSILNSEISIKNINQLQNSLSFCFDSETVN